jgi:hypothetical protein
MERVAEQTKEELRLEIALLRGFQPLHTVTGIKLMKALPRPSAFAPPQNLEAPDWPNDVAACFRLLRDFSAESDRVEVTRADGQWSCRIVSCGREFYACAETPELAICRAYLPARRARE